MCACENVQTCMHMQLCVTVSVCVCVLSDFKFEKGPDPREKGERERKSQKE